MVTINPNGKQTMIDLAMQYYGNVEALPELMELNPHVLTVSQAMSSDVEIVYDETSPLMNQEELKKMKGAIVSTYQSTRFVSIAESYFQRMLVTGDKVCLYRDMVALDRLMRNLGGESFALFDTYNQWSRFDGFCLYPMPSGDDVTKGLNLANPAAFDIDWTNGPGVFRKRYYAPCDPEVYKMTGFTYGTDLTESDFACGVFVLNEADGNLMGKLGSVGTKGFSLNILAGDLYFTCTGSGVGTTYAQAAGWGNKSGLIMGDSAGGDVSVWHNNTMEAQAVYDAAYVSAAQSTPLIGHVGGVLTNDAPNKIAFAFACKGFGLSAQGQAEQKAFCNAVHYYLYQRGVIKEFTPFI